MAVPMFSVWLGIRRTQRARLAGSVATACNAAKPVSRNSSVVAFAAMPYIGEKTTYAGVMAKGSVDWLPEN